MALKNTIRKHLLEQNNQDWETIRWWIPERCSNILSPPSSNPVKFEPYGNLKFSRRIPDRKKYLDPRLIEKLKKLSDSFGEGITITSAGRPKRGGGAKCSQHFVAKAVDLVPDKNTEENILKLAKIASSLGFTGIGIYSGPSIHVDIRQNKSIWGNGFTRSGIPSWAKETLNNHMGGEYYNKDLADLELDTTPDQKDQGFLSSVKTKIEDKLKKMNAPEDSLEELVNLVIKAIFKS